MTGRKGSRRDPLLMRREHNRARRRQQAEPTLEVRQSDQTEPAVNEPLTEPQQPPRKRRNPELSRKETPLRALHSPHLDPINNVLIGFKISRKFHLRMRLIAAERRVKLSTVIIEAIEYLLNLREQKELRYHAPPIGNFGLRTTMWISQTLNHKLESLIKQDQRSASMIVETATIAYLDALDADT